MSPSLRRVAVALACVLALSAGFYGATWYLARTPPPAAEAAAAEPVRPDGPIVVHAAGDAIPTDGSAWTGVAGLFASDDLTIVNLECAASELGRPEDKLFTFRCPHAPQAMRASGVEVANQANNHSGDFGAAAQMDGRARLLAAGVAPVGTGHDIAEAAAPALFELRGRTVAVLGFGGVLPSRSWAAGPSHPGQADGYDVASMVRAVRDAGRRADIVLVVIHWGEELDSAPRPDDVARAHAMIDAGADAIFGSHAHRLQPLETYRGRPIFYGLGNFVWPRDGRTAVAEVLLPRSGPIRACLLAGRIAGGRPELSPAGSGCRPDATRSSATGPSPGPGTAARRPRSA